MKYDNKTLQEIRFYDYRCYPIIEIGYHPEPGINNNGHEPVVHFHFSIIKFKKMS